VDPQPVEVWDRYRLLHCRACDLQIWDPPTAGDADWYDNSEHYLSTPYVTWLGWSHRRALEELPVGARTLLDIGCADGRFVYAAAARGLDARGIDHNDSLVRAGNARHAGSRLSTSSIASLVAGDRTFDAVSLFDVIEHVPDPVALLELARSVIRPQGMIVVSTPNRLGYPWGRHPMDRPPHHLTRWVPLTLVTALRRAGFTDIRIITSPGRAGIREMLMTRVRFGLVQRALRRRRASQAGGPAGRSLTIGRAIIFKDRLVRIGASVLTPALGWRYAGGSMIAIAEKPLDR
jgi:SAM-dependent methyltransferase